MSHNIQKYFDKCIMTQKLISERTNIEAEQEIKMMELTKNKKFNITNKLKREHI